DEPAVRQLIADRLGADATRRFSASVHAYTDGNPFFIEQVLHDVSETNATDGVALGVPEGVRDVISRRIQRLPDDVGRLLGTASVIGREFGIDLVEAVTGSVPDDLLDSLDAAVAAEVIHEVPGTI